MAREQKVKGLLIDSGNCEGSTTLVPNCISQKSLTPSPSESRIMEEFSSSYNPGKGDVEDSVVFKGDA